MLPLPERSWDVSWKRKLPGIVALGIARALLKAPRRRSPERAGAAPVIVATGGFGDQFRLMNVLSRYDLGPVAAFSKYPSTLSLYNFNFSELVETNYGNLLPVSLRNWNREKAYRIGLVPHPFVQQPLDIALSRALAVTTAFASTREYRYDCAADVHAVAADRSTWRSFYESFIESAVNVSPAFALPRLAGGLRHRGSRSQRVALHPLSSGSDRRLPPAVWQQIISALERRDLEPWLLGSRDDIEMLEVLSSGSSARLIAGKALQEVANFLADCRAFVGLDSSMMHLADALGVPSVVLYTFTCAEVAGPFFTSFESLQLAPPQMLSAEVLVWGKEKLEPDIDGLESRFTAALERLRL